MDSDSDLPVVQNTLGVLDSLGIPREVKITSAHLAGTVAGLTVKPVIGVPLDAGPLQGMDSLLSTVQMPGGIPVGCVAIGKAGAKNAAYLAAQVLAVSDSTLAERLQAGSSV